MNLNKLGNRWQLKGARKRAKHVLSSLDFCQSHAYGILKEMVSTLMIGVDKVMDIEQVLGVGNVTAGSWQKCRFRPS